MDLLEVLAENVKRYRDRAKLTQDALAEMAELSQQAVYLIEAAKRWPKPDNLLAIATALKVEPWQLLASDEQVKERNIDRLIISLARARGVWPEES